MKNMDRVIFGSVLLIGLGFGLNAQACSSDNWDDDPNTTVGSPFGTADVINRFSELCAMQVDDQGAPGYVQSNGTTIPDDRYIGRFYVFPNVSGSGDVDILVAYSDDLAAPEDELFAISFDGTHFNFDAGGATGGSDSWEAESGWNLVEFEFNSDGTFNYWVNAAWNFDTLSYAAPSGSFDSGTGGVQAVRLGTPNGMAGQSGSYSFDAFEAHRSTNVGALIACDADDSGNPDINVNDILAVIDERFGSPPTLAQGQPDCNFDGEINLNDILETINVAFPPVTPSS